MADTIGITVNYKGTPLNLDVPKDKLQIDKDGNVTGGDREYLKSAIQDAYVGAQVEINKRKEQRGSTLKTAAPYKPQAAPGLRMMAGPVINEIDKMGSGYYEDPNIPAWRKGLGAATDVAEIAMGGGAAPAMINAPKAGLKALVGFEAGSRGVQAASNAMGAPPEVSQALGDVAGFGTGGIAASPRIGEALDAGMSRARNTPIDRATLGGGAGFLGGGLMSRKIGWPTYLGAVPGAAIGSRAMPFAQGFMSSLVHGQTPVIPPVDYPVDRFQDSHLPNPQLFGPEVEGQPTPQNAVMNVPHPMGQANAGFTMGGRPDPEWTINLRGLPAPKEPIVTQPPITPQLERGPIQMPGPETGFTHRPVAPFEEGPVPRLTPAQMQQIAGPNSAPHAMGPATSGGLSLLQPEPKLIEAPNYEKETIGRNPKDIQPPAKPKPTVKPPVKKTESPTVTVKPKQAEPDNMVDAINKRREMEAAPLENISQEMFKKAYKDLSIEQRQRVNGEAQLRSDAEQIRQTARKPVEPPVKKDFEPAEPKKVLDNKKVMSFANVRKQGFTSADVAERLGATLQEASEYLKKMESDGLLERKGATWYAKTSDVTEAEQKRSRKVEKPSKDPKIGPDEVPVPVSAEDMISGTATTPAAKEARLRLLQEKESLTPEETKEILTLEKEFPNAKAPEAQKVESADTQNKESDAEAPSSQTFNKAILEAKPEWKPGDEIDSSHLDALAKSTGMKRTPLARMLKDQGYDINKEAFGTYGTGEKRVGTQEFEGMIAMFGGDMQKVLKFMESTGAYLDTYTRKKYNLPREAWKPDFSKKKE